MPTIALCTLLAVGRCFQAETAANTKPAAKRMLPPLLLLLLALAGQGAGPPPSFRTRSGSVCRGPPVISSGGIAGLNALVENVAAAWQWLDRSHTSGFVGNFNQTNLIPLNWTYLNGVPLPQDAHHRPQQSHSFEPNENHKTAPILLDLARFPGGAIMHPTATMPYNQLAAVILRTYTAILDPASPLFANFLTDWKDQAILGYPTPATNQNTNPGYSFTRNGREKYQADMVAADGQLYGLFSAAAHELQTGVCPERCVSDPARHVAADLAGLGAPLRWSATGFVDEQLFQAMNRFLRGDWASVKRMLDGAIDRNNGNAWDSVGFGKNRKPGYRGEFLGMYLSVSRIAAPVLREKGFKLSSFDEYDRSPVWDAVETSMWKLWQNHAASHHGGGIPGAYANISSAGRNFDSEGNIAATYPYACSWHDRVRATALSGVYNATTPPGVPGDENSIVVAGSPTPDGSPL